MIKKQTNARELRHKRVRKKIKGTTARPRLCVSKSLKHMYVQIINDEEGRTLVSCSSLSKDFKDLAVKNGSITSAKSIGELVAVKAIEAGIKQVVFDRGGYLYHGQVKALAEAAREKGLVF